MNSKILVSILILVGSLPFTCSAALQDDADRAGAAVQDGFVEYWDRAARVYQDTFVPIHNKFERQYREQDFDQLSLLSTILTSVKIEPNRVDSDLRHWTHRLAAAQILEEAVNSDDPNAIEDARAKAIKTIEEIYESGNSNSSMALSYRELEVKLRSMKPGRIAYYQEDSIRKIEQATKMKFIYEQAREIVNAGSPEQQEEKKQELIEKFKTVGDAYRLAKDEHRTQVKSALGQNAILIENVKASFSDEVLKQLSVESYTFGSPEVEFDLDRGFLRLWYKHNDQSIRVTIYFSLFSRRIFPRQGRINPLHIKPLDPSKEKVGQKYLVREDFKNKLRFDVNNIPIAVESFGVKTDLRKFVVDAIDLEMLAKLSSPRRVLGDTPEK